MPGMDFRLKHVRKQRGLTLAELAARIGTTADQLSRLERGERQVTLGWLERIARGLNVEPVSLIGGEVIDDDERAWLHCYRKMSGEERTRWLRMLVDFTERDPLAPKAAQR